MALLMVFDVESIGLHGEGYAVAYAVLESPTGIVREEGYFSCRSQDANGDPTDRNWIQVNVDPALALLPATHEWPILVRHAFWEKWVQWRGLGASLFAQCGWPVEARFLTKCVDDDFANRKWKGPFPLREITDYVQAGAMADPKAHEKINQGRLSNELPDHNPIMDVRRSARILVEAQRVLWAKSTT